MPDRTCSIEGCDNPTRARSWCMRHYNRWYQTAVIPQSPERCANCGEPLGAKTNPSGPRSPYCSKSCRNRASYARRRGTIRERRAATHLASLTPRACAQCSETFTPARSNRQIYCSKRCLRAATRDNSTATCAEPDCDRSVRARGLCAKHYNAKYKKVREWSTGKPETRRATLRRKTQLRRARLSDPDATPIDRDRIGERDGWRCGLCGRKVDRRLVYPHPSSASLDHIEPLSTGGMHTTENVQIAHLRCNVAKGNRGGGEQLLLIG